MTDNPERRQGRHDTTRMLEMTQTHNEIKNNYRHFSDYMLGTVVRMNREKAASIDRGLNDGSIAKAYRKAGGDVAEHLLAIKSINEERWAVAKACAELLAERQR